MEMNSETYKTIRQQLGTQAAVAARLGVSRECVARRETGKAAITVEASFAIQSLSAAIRAASKQ
tara:strand:- start:978 stop:1169 length:192 start_codon:yes stop_codon:yes gene_type:complete